MPTWSTRITNFIKRSANTSWSAIKTGSSERQRLTSVLNGLIGDRLAESKSDLAITMTLYDENGLVDLNSLSTNNSQRKIMLFVHGSCDSEKTWFFDDGLTYGSKLTDAKKYSCYYLRYNSGLHISQNGQQLNQLLQKISILHPKTFQKIYLVGHSMGGLVIRSACYYGRQKKVAWINRVKKIFLIGVPNEGAVLERVGNITTKLLRLFVSPYTQMASDLIDARSAGIKDLRHGYLIDSDWHDKEPSELNKHDKTEVALLPKVSYYMIAGTLFKDKDSIASKMLGDGLVHTGSSHSVGQQNNLSKVAIATVVNVSHHELARSQSVFSQFIEFMG